MSQSDKNHDSIIEHIYNWSLDKPLWLRDALRRIVKNIVISDSDIDDLIILLKDECGLRQSRLALPLLESDISSTYTSESIINIDSISNVADVNSLAPNQTLTFNGRGITVVYGDNGVGKSGYARIFKSACRARHRSEIQPNLNEAPTSNAPRADISYYQDGKKEKTVNWKSTDSPHSILSAVSVFDSKCASVHLEKKNELAYRPYGLDIPDILASACKQIETKLKMELNIKQQNKNAIFLAPPWNSKTRIGQLILNITGDTDIIKIEKMSSLDKNDLVRLDQLNEAVTKDLDALCQEQNLKRQRIQRLEEIISSINESLCDAKIKEVSNLRAQAIKAREAATIAADKSFSANTLLGVGEKIWQQLWESAKSYSEHCAYPDKKFPVISDGAVCVLCQQSLTVDASTRLKTFENFIRGDTERKAKIAESEFEKCYRVIYDNKIILSKHIKEILEEINICDKDLSKLVYRFLASARLRRAKIIMNLSGTHEKISNLTQNGADKLAKLKLSFTKHIKELQEAMSSKNVKQLNDERDELFSRKAVFEHIKAVNSEITRQGELSFLQKCINETKTKSITLLGNAIADSVVTNQLRDMFLKEIIQLVGASFRVEVQRISGAIGVPQFKVCLVAKPGVDVTNILSEGEQTCVAIAAFFSEIGISNNKSALVFDDPITSLDHKWRNKVAERLVLEAKTRQIIVFTHDLVFLNDLADYSDEYDIDFCGRHLTRFPEMVGIINENFPWDGMKIKQRIDFLEKEARSLISGRNLMDNETYDVKARNFYSLLRASWERALEEVGLSHAIMRYRDSINAKNVIKISALGHDECTNWYKNFTRCCNYVDGHDPARGSNRNLPAPNELLQDVVTLSQWINTLKEKHKCIP